MIGSFTSGFKSKSPLNSVSSKVIVTKIPKNINDIKNIVKFFLSSHNKCIKKNATKLALIVATSIAVQNVGASDYNFTVKGVQANDPTLTLERGKTYEFDVSAQGHPFWIKTDQVTGSSSQYNEGITNNGLSSGKLTFAVPSDAPSTLYYICQIHGNMTGIIKIVDNNDNGTILGNNNSGNTSTPSYGYSLDLELAFGNDQDFIPTSGYDI